MLYRISGTLTDGTPFSARIEGVNAVRALATGREALNQNGTADENVAELRVRAVRNGGSSVKFGKVKTAEEKAAAKLARAEREKGKTAPKDGHKAAGAAKK